MNSIVVHYKELALKGRNRPWFVQMLVRNLKVALAGLDIAAVRSLMGRIEIELGRGASAGPTRGIACGMCSASRTSRSPAAARTISMSLAAAILRDLGDRRPAVVPRAGPAIRQAVPVHVAADRA